MHSSMGVQRENGKYQEKSGETVHSIESDECETRLNGPAESS
jgi:hypothetical protein